MKITITNANNDINVFDHADWINIKDDDVHNEIQIHYLNENERCEYIVHGAYPDTAISISFEKRRFKSWDR